jgi:pyrimidine oxygenase
MDIGVFIPIGNNGWLISETAPQYMPTFELNKEIVQKAESYGFDFALSMIKLRGFGGKTQFWEHNLESFTLMAGLAAVTSKIKIFATGRDAHHAGTDRRADGLDHRFHRAGRFGINLITGWQKAEYDQMGLWPGESHYKDRYNYLAGVRDGAARADGDRRQRLQGQVPGDARLPGQPAAQGREADLRRVVGRGPGLHRPVRGLFLRARQGDNTPTAFAPVNDRLAAAASKTGRDVGSYILFMIIADETDEAAMAKWQLYRDGADQDALQWLTNQAAPNAQGGTSNTNTTQLAAPESAVNLNMGTLVGSYDSVARMLDEVADVPDTAGVLLVFDDFVGRGGELRGEDSSPR